MNTYNFSSILPSVISLTSYCIREMILIEIIVGNEYTEDMCKALLLQLLMLSNKLFILNVKQILRLNQCYSII